MKLQNYEREHLKRLRSNLGECTVLLKYNGDFPLEQAGKIAVYGNGARHTVKGGTGSGEVNSHCFVTVEQGLEAAGFSITSKKWLDDYDSVLEGARKTHVKEVKQAAKQAHVNAVVFGMGSVVPEAEYELPLEGEGDVGIYILSRNSGEGNDRKPQAGDILLTETEKRDILLAQKKYHKFMLVLNVGGPVDLTPVAEVDNILILSQLGVETGSAFADILLGKSFPSGKLATTWSAWADYPSIGTFGDENDVRYNEGIYVGYRYFDSVGKKALFPFGFGLGYTDFAWKAEEVSIKGENVSIRASVKNIGKRPGKEVLQLYVSLPEGRLDQPYQILAGWEKTGVLLPGKSSEITISFAMSEIVSYDTENAKYLLEQGDYILRLGNSSVNTEICGVIRLDEAVNVRQVRNALGKTDFTDWKPEKRESIAVPQDITILHMKASAIPVMKVEYGKEQAVDPLIEKLNDEELAYMNVGAFDPKGGIGNIIGSAATTVAGAAGETTGMLKNRGIPVLVMADGPAGLRLAPEYTKDENGVHPVGNPLTEGFTMYLNPVARYILKLLNGKPKKGAEIQYQYATAIPIGSAISQSWNLEFAETCGDIVGAEMERFKIHLWLAPALNIHRNICCGRNFEYYSEDPQISGKFAAAITRGVQKHPGCGTTIKHYAANNQETNRYNNNSIVSERVMREIYLRGFEICVKESQPKALMTSYNLLNGVHTSERRDLIEDILRCEYGFEGIVMTDWVTAGGILSKNAAYPPPEAYKVAAAGNDLFMPGSKKEFDNITAALSDGRIDRKQLQINASRIYRMACELNCIIDSHTDGHRRK